MEKISQPNRVGISVDQLLAGREKLKIRHDEEGSGLSSSKRVGISVDELLVAREKLACKVDQGARCINVSDLMLGRKALRKTKEDRPGNISVKDIVVDSASKVKEALRPQSGVSVNDLMLGRKALRKTKEDRPGNISVKDIVVDSASKVKEALRPQSGVSVNDLMLGRKALRKTNGNDSKLCKHKKSLQPAQGKETISHEPAVCQNLPGAEGKRAGIGFSVNDLMDGRKNLRQTSPKSQKQSVSANTKVLDPPVKAFGKRGLSKDDLLLGKDKLQKTQAEEAFNISADDDEEESKEETVELAPRRPAPPPPVPPPRKDVKKQELSTCTMCGNTIDLTNGQFCTVACKNYFEAARKLGFRVDLTKNQSGETVVVLEDKPNAQTPLMNERAQNAMFRKRDEILNVRKRHKNKQNK